MTDDDDLADATHCDRDGDLWRVTPSGAAIWSHHLHRWVESRSILDLGHRIHGASWLTPVRHVTPRRTA